MFSTIMFFLAATAPADGIELKLIPSGATEKVGGYAPLLTQLTNDASDVRKMPEGLAAPRYGKIMLWGKSITFILDDPKDKPGSLYVDTNDDGDLTNDPKATWQIETKDSQSMYMGSAKVDIGKGEPVAIKFYRFDPKIPERAGFKNKIAYYQDYGYEVTLTLDGKAFKSAIVGEPDENEKLDVDRNRDGNISPRYEVIPFGISFNFTGTTYILQADDEGFKLEKAPKPLTLIPMPPDLGIGNVAPVFTAKAMDGSTIDFPKTYKGKVVLLNFWAGWSNPSLDELPHVKAVYDKWRGKGFDVLGVSFDQENVAEKIADFTKRNGMLWKQIYEGRGWDTTLAVTYDVSKIPFTLLVDGDTGKILASGDELRGPDMVKVVEKALVAKKRP